MNTSVGSNAPSTVTAVGSHVRTKVVNSSGSIPCTLPLGNGGTYVSPQVSWEWPSNSCSIACSVNNGVGNNAPGGLVARSVPHVFLPACQNVYPTESMMSVLPLGKFSGQSESEVSEQFTDLIEQFEVVASAYCWDDRTKLVNLTTRLRGQAFAYYRSSSTQQRNDNTIPV